MGTKCNAHSRHEHFMSLRVLLLTTISLCRNVQVGGTAYVEQTANEIHVLISTPHALDTVRCSRRRRTFTRIFSSEEQEESILVRNSALFSETSKLRSYSREKFLATPTLDGGLHGLKYILQ